MTTDHFTGTAMTRHDGWTLERQLGFLEALADGGNVARAAAAVGMSASSAYRLRGRLGGRGDSDVFAYGWQAAQAMAYYRLRDIALDRIDHGVATPSVYHGEVVATKTVFSDRLLVAMLDHLKPAAGTLGPTGLRRPADDPARDFAATIDSYDAAIADGGEPAMPQNTTGCVNGCAPRRTMTREEFIAAIEGRPRTADLEKANREYADGKNDADENAGENANENAGAGVNFA